METPLREIAQHLPHFAIERVGESAAISVPDEIPSAYVWPRISYASANASGQVLLISAPGAMGKTMAAEALAAEAKVPRLDLSQIRVGNGTLAGELGKFLGMAPAGAFMERLVLGQSAIVIDGLDEAQLRSGTENFFAFLQDLAELIRDSASNCQVMLLGRPDSISGASTVLSESKVSVVEATLEPLSFSSAQELIIGSLDQTDYATHRKFVDPFSELLSHVFRDLGRALVGRDGEVDINDLWADSKAFLGYPPVILAISRRLAVSNPRLELERLRERGATSAMNRGRLLQQICEDILDREQEKVRKSVADALGLRESDPKVRLLYSREEQLVRILDYISDAHMAVIPPESLTPGEKRNYEDLISSFIVDHPFLVERRFSSVVFSDYLRSFVSTSETITAFGPSRSELISYCPEVGPFLFHFIHALCMTAEAEGVWARVGEDAVDSLLRSFQIEDNPSRFATFVQTDGVAHLVLAYGEEHDGVSGARSSIAFHVEELSGVIEISTPISHANLVTDAGLVVRSRSGVCEIGPSVILVAEEIELSGDRMFILPPQGAEFGVLVGFNSATHDPLMQISSPREGALTVFAGERVHPWSRYVPDLPRGTSINATKMREGVIQVRRILTAFGRSMGDSPARNRELIERVVVGNTGPARDIFSGLLRLGYIVEDGSLYRLDLDQLAAAGVSYGVIKGSQFETALAPIVQRIYEAD